MLYILLIISIIILFVGTNIDSKKTSIYADAAGATIIGTILTVIFSISLLVCLSYYNSTASTSEAKLKVLNNQNEEILKQIEPIVKNAITYEVDVYNNLKIDSTNLIALGQMYPELKNNVFIQTQLDVIINNQQEIKKLKLERVSLNAYRMWLFTKKWDFQNDY